MDKKEGWNVRLIKIVTGEEVICTAGGETYDGKGIHIKDCLQVVVQPGKTDPQTGKTEMVFGFAPWATMAKDKIYIDNTKIIYITELEDEVLAHYNRLFGHVQIQVPPKKLVVTR